MASLRSRSTGCVVPSKFFGSLAVGRPVLFAGDSHSAIAKWIGEYKVGWVLSDDTIDEIATDLICLSENKSELVQMQQRCHRVYQENFSKKRVTSLWDKHLNALLAINKSPATQNKRIANSPEKQSQKPK
jgi:glycosyltransferase involved in cell wall biosynthesis